MCSAPDDVSALTKAIVRRNNLEVQEAGDFALYDCQFADVFADHTPQPGMGAYNAGVRRLYQVLRAAFPDLMPEIIWQTEEGGLVTTYKIYHGTHRGTFLNIAATGRRVSFEAVDVMRIFEGRITDHWGVGNLYSLVVQLRGTVNDLRQFKNEQ